MVDDPLGRGKEKIHKFEIPSFLSEGINALNNQTVDAGDSALGYIQSHI